MKRQIQKNTQEFTLEEQQVKTIIGIIKECSNRGSVSGIDGSFGGIAGINYADNGKIVLIEKCENRGTIKSTGIASENVGGIAGWSNGNITESKNIGKVTGANQDVGGIVGDTKQEGNKVTSCSNDGEIRGGQKVGGIAGYSEKSIVDNCNNNGIIVGDGVLNSEDNQYQVIAGGIVGSANSQSEIRNSHNYNEVKAIAETGKTKIIFGGITGGTTNSTIYNCYNEGKIGTLENGIVQVGGISGAVAKESTIKQCYNKKEINGQNYVGGVAGDVGWNSVATINNCYNIGEIRGITNNIGGICAVSPDTTGSEIRNCYNIGNVSATNQGNNTYIRRSCRNKKLRKYDSYQLLLFTRYMRRRSEFKRYKRSSRKQNRNTNERY